PLWFAAVPTSSENLLLVPHMKPGIRDKTLAAPLTLIAAWDPNWHNHLPQLAPHKDGAREKLEPDLAVRESMAKVSSHLQIGYLLVALRAHGLHIGPMTGFNTAGVDAECHADNGWKTVVIINVGWGPNPVEDNAVRPRAGRLSYDDACQIV